MINVRRATVAVASASVLMLNGCKKEEAPAPPPPPPPAPKAEVAPPPPPKPPELPVERAVKECAAPLELAPAQALKFGAREATLAGYKLTFKDKDADGVVNLGVLGPVNDDSGANMVSLKKYVAFFKEQKADAVVFTGDVGEDSAEKISRVLKAVAESGLPVFVVAGNSECRASFTDGVNAAKAQFPNVVNLNSVRAVEFQEVTLVSLPGYHDPNYVKCSAGPQAGCVYFKSTVDEVVKVAAEAKEAKRPVVLVSHGPPRGEGDLALDRAQGVGNVGDPQINAAVKQADIAFGLHSNIKEAGGRATDLGGTTLINQDTWVKSLYLAAGPADTWGWDMNDGTKSSGFAAVLSVKGDEGSWKLFRNKPLTAAEKAEAKKLEPAAPQAADGK
jgi:Icc-related predicted phosphoesterase